jgi:Ca2+-binding RTX toxin-like protein
VAISGRSLGTNLAGIAQWSTQDPFLDYFKSARLWIPQKFDVWDTQEQALLNLDQNGWLRSFPNPGSSAQFTQVSTVFLPFGEAARPGRYIIQYDGVGNISYGLGGVKLAAESTPGRDVVQLVTMNGTPTIVSDANQQPILLQINSTDPNNYLRNIRIYHEDDLALVESGQIFRPEFLQNIKEYGGLRFMDWMITNYIKSSEWQQRPRVDQATWAGDGVPVEVMVELANTTGSNPWFTMPHLASDDYIRQFATYVRDNLDPSLVAYVEFSNEVWNWQFEQTGWAYNQGIANLKDANGNPPTAPNIQWYGVRASQTADIWREVFNQKPAAPSLKTVFATQSAWLGLEGYALDAPNWVARGNRPPKESFDVYAIAPYFGNEFGLPDNQATVRQWAQEGEAGLVKAFNHLRNGNGGLVGARSVNQIVPELTYHKSVATANGMELAAYEGGQHLVGVLGVENDPIIQDFFQRLNNDPRMGQLYTDYFTLWKQSGGNLFANFSDVVAPSKWGQWGNLDRWNQASSPRQDAVLNFIRDNPRWWEDGTPNQTVGQYNRAPLATSNITLAGGLDSDTLIGGVGDDTILGNAGNDTLIGQSGNDSLEGGIGVDNLQGQDGNDRLVGGDGDDSILGNVGNDTLQGNNGIDYVFGDFGIDSLLGGIGGDYLDGGADPDTLIGNEDSDTLLGGADNDSLDGGATADYLLGQDGNDTLLGSDGNDTIVGGAGADSVLGGNDADLVMGGDDADTLSGGAGNDAINGEAGNDSLLGGDGDDYILGSLGGDILLGEAGLDTLLGGTEGDYLDGGVDNDVLFGELGNDTLIGVTGNDFLIAGDGLDSLDGGEGNDLLIGEAGNDTLAGGSESDYLSGGAGADEFIFGAPGLPFFAHGIDTVSDFSTDDRLVLNRGTFSVLTSIAGSGFSAANEFAVVTTDAAAETSAAFIVYNSTTGSLFYNPNGTAASFGNGGNGGMFIKLNSNPSLSASSFTLKG